VDRVCRVPPARYSATGVRSYSNSAPSSYFSSGNGQTLKPSYSQSGGGADYADWDSAGTPHVQDAFGTPGAMPNLNMELTALDVIGYTPTGVPEPSPLALAAVGALALARRLTAASKAGRRSMFAAPVSGSLQS
jgi:hypothetical protein